MFRKPIAWHWHVVLGAASILTFLVVYTVASAWRQSVDPRDMLYPNWGQLWQLGVVAAFTPQRTGVADLTEQERQRIADEAERLRLFYRLPDAERLTAEEERLRGLAASATTERLKAEDLRLRGLAERGYGVRQKAKDDQDKALELLSPDVRAKAEEGLRKLQEFMDRSDEARVQWKIPLLEDVRATFFRLFVGLTIVMLVSLTLGVLMGCYAPVEAYFYPPLAILAKVPGTAMLSVFFAIVGLNFNFYQAMILFGMIPTVAQTIYHYAKEVPEELLFKARTLGASQAECIFSVILPNILPKVLETLRLAVGPALIFLYAAEFVYGEVGLGCRLRLLMKKGLIESPMAYFYLVIIGLSAFLIDYGLRRLQRKLCPWYYSQ